MALFGKRNGGNEDIMLVSRHGLTTGNCGPAFASIPLTLVSTVGNIITVEDDESQQWAMVRDAPVAAQGEWVRFSKVVD